MLIGEPGRLNFGQPVPRERLGSGRGQGAKALRRAVDHCHRHLGGDPPPVFPAMKLRKIVSAHDPDQTHAGNAAAELDDRIDGVAGPDDSFETADVDPRVVGDLSRRVGALGEIVQPVGILEGIAWGQQPPDAVEFQALECKQADRAVRGVRRIERAAEQADPHAVGMERYRSSR